MKEINLIKCPICNSSSRICISNLYDDRYGYKGEYDLFECDSCSHKFLNVQMSDEQISDLYSNYYPRSSFDINSFKPMSFVNDFKSWFNGEKRAFAFVPENVKVLDIGCGFGESLGYHKSRNCEVYGIEADQNILRVGEKFGFNVKVGVFKGGLYPDNFFDYVTMDQVLEHSFSPKELLSAVCNCLKPNGKLVLTFPNANGFGASYFGRKWIHWHSPYHIQFFSRKSFEKIINETGFVIKEFRTVTSSEWLYYQEIHNITCPQKSGEESFFWSPKKNWSNLPDFVKKRRSLIDRVHKYKLNHIFTRLLDIFRAGDNYLIILQKNEV